MAVYVNGKNVGVIIEPSTKDRNIEIYKYQDLEDRISNGGSLPTEEEYEQAEEYLQEIYKVIMYGGN